MGIHVTQHAIERYRERVADIPDDAIRDTLKCPAIEMAAQFSRGHEIHVRYANGTRAVIKEGCIITVLPRTKK